MATKQEPIVYHVTAGVRAIDIIEEPGGFIRAAANGGRIGTGVALARTSLLSIEATNRLLEYFRSEIEAAVGRLRMECVSWAAER